MNAIKAHDANWELAKRVRTSLAAKRGELSKLVVLADEGTVRLTGKVSSYHLRQIAITAAKQVAGVREVVDGVEISES